MKRLKVIVPVKNEELNIPQVARQINDALVHAKIPYTLLFVVDSSTDNTLKRAKSLKKLYPIEVIEKKGLPGKGYSILEGLDNTDAPFTAFIDGDLQYPPHMLPEMFRIATANDDIGVVVAHRKIYEGTIIRKIGSKLNAFLFGKLLLGLNCDLQSGLKLFRSDIIPHINKSHVTAWTFDIPLLHAAKEMGYKIGKVDITFTARKNGVSKVGFIKTALAIAYCAIKTRLAANRILSLNHGFAYKGKKYITHSKLPHHQSALSTFLPKQKSAILFALSLILGSLALFPFETALSIIAVLSLIYFLDFAFSFYVVLKSLHNPPELNFTDEEIKQINEKELPIYTILCPLYKESHVLPHFVASINELDWPKDKLDVILLLEEDDIETINVAHNMRLPSHFSIAVVPNSNPKTKPKACNFGLKLARGEYIVIFDAEDSPEYSQLKKAYLSFKNSNHKVACVQAKLNYYNPHQNILTRLFAAEYSLWFDVILPGFQSISTVIPLGGTSNHFKTQILKDLKGWDSFNVTEDAELGVRLFREGFETAIVDSTTWEEANSSLKGWIKQRSRWLKGYLQTYLVHMREPTSFFTKHGIHALIFQLVIGMRISFILINPILWAATISYFTFYQYVGPAIQALYPAAIFYLAGISLVFGNFMYLYNYMIGLAKREKWDLLKYVYLVPVYWGLMSISAGIAFYQLLFKPHHWEKTVHGLHLISRKAAFAYKSTEKFVNIFENPVYIISRNIRNLVLLFKPLPEEIFVKVDENVKNILVFNWRDMKHMWAGGAELYVHEISKRLVKSGNNVVVFCGNDGKNPDYELMDNIHIVRRGGFFTVYFWAAIYYFVQIRNKIDVVIDSENGIPFFTPLFVRKPIVCLVHHVHQEIFRKNLPRPLAAIACLLEAKLFPLIYKDVRMITVSESSRKDMQAIGLGKNKGIELVHPGIDPQKFTTSRKTETPTILYLGRLKPYKSIDVVIKAMTHILPKYPNAKLKIAGFGESKETLKNFTRQLNLENNVEFLGKVTEDEKVKLMGESWVFVNPSSMEGWGISVLEANACGTPVVAANVKGLVDSVKNPHTGFLVEYGKDEEFAGRIVQIIENPKLRKDFESESINWAKSFTWDKSSNKLKNLLEELE